MATVANLNAVVNYAAHRVQSAQDTKLTISLLLVVFALGITAPAAAQDANSAPLDFRTTLDELTKQPTISHPLFGHDVRRKIGPLTLVTPTHPGEMVRFSLPIGELAVRAARVVGNVRQRRAERKAQAEVQRAIREWASLQPSR